VSANRSAAEPRREPIPINGKPVRPPDQPVACSVCARHIAIASPTVARTLDEVSSILSGSRYASDPVVKQIFSRRQGLFGLLFKCTISVRGNRLRERVSLLKHFCPFSISHKTSTPRVAFSLPSPSSPTNMNQDPEAKVAPKATKHPNLRFLD